MPVSGTVSEKSPAGESDPTARRYQFTGSRRISPRKSGPPGRNPGAAAKARMNAAFERPFESVIVAVPVDVSVPETSRTGSGGAFRVTPLPTTAGAGLQGETVQVPPSTGTEWTTTAE